MALSAYQDHETVPLADPVLNACPKAAQIAVANRQNSEFAFCSNGQMRLKKGILKND